MTLRVNAIGEVVFREVAHYIREGTTNTGTLPPPGPRCLTSEDSFLTP